MNSIKLSLLACALLASAGAWSQSGDAAKRLLEQSARLCKAKGGLAELAVTARQSGVPLSEMLALDKGEGSAERSSIVMRAYEFPVYGLPQIDNKTPTDFRAEIELECFKKIR